MFRLRVSPTLSITVRATATRQTPNIQREIHNVPLAPLHTTLHQTTEPASQLHGLRLHDHQAYQNATPSSSSSTFKVQQANISTANIQQSIVSTSIKESKILCELREACARQAAMARDMEFRESRGRSCTLRNLGDWEPQASFGEKTLAQFIASKAIASSVLPAEKESKEEKGVKTEVRNHLGVRRGLNPILSRARVGTERTLCAADLDDMYNL